jgi:hypothetical protein
MYDFSYVRVLLAGLLLGQAGCKVGTVQTGVPPGNNCTAESDSDLCARLGKDCGAFFGTDNCAAARSVTSCGTCSGADTCGGGGVANLCGRGATCGPCTGSEVCSATGVCQVPGTFAISTGLVVDKSALGFGETLTASVTYQNGPGASLSVADLVITARPPGGTHAGGPYFDFSPRRTAQTVAAGATLSLTATRTIASGNPAGEWEVFSTWEDATETWHDGPSIYVTVGACTPTTCELQSKNCDSISNGCGGTLECGTCSGSDTCGGGGVPNVCGQGALPAAPTALSAVAGDSQVLLYWNSVQNVALYHVKRAAASGGPYSEVAAPTGATYTNTGLNNGTPYYYVVSAGNAAGESGNSNEVSATPVAGATGQVHSLEFGHTGDNGKDYCNPVPAPAGGTLFSVWTKVPGTLEYPASAGKIRGNMIVYRLYGTNWGLMALVGNIDAYPQGDPGGAGGIYNANYMFGLGSEGGDYSVFYDRTRRPLSVLNDWIWVAWQVVVNPNKSITFRQWLKYGIDGQVFAAGNQKGFTGQPLEKEGEEIAYFSQQPGEAVNFQVGYNNYYDNEQHIPNSYLCHARMEALGMEPTLEYLDAISRLNHPDASAWADYELNWVDGAPNLQDRSGHGRNLSVKDGGVLYQGPLSPVF